MKVILKVEKTAIARQKTPVFQRFWKLTSGTFDNYKSEDKPVVSLVISIKDFVFMIFVLLIIIVVCFAIIFAMFGISGLTQSAKKKVAASKDIEQHPTAIS